MAVTHSPLGAPGEWPESLDIALRSLRPIEEKVVRWSYGMGCQRAHSAAEIAVEFGVDVELVEAVLEEAAQRLAAQGVTRQQLQQAGQPRLRSRHGCRGR